MAKKDDDTKEMVKPVVAEKAAPAPAAPHPLEVENAALKARVAKLEAALKHAVAHGLNYTQAHEALHS